VLKLSARSGLTQWRRFLTRPSADPAATVEDLVVAADGDVIAAGGMGDGRSEFVVMRLSATSGRPRWQRTIVGAPRPPFFGYDHSAHAVAVDAAGDVVAAGTVEAATYVQYHQSLDLAVVKLAGTSGEERWRYVLDGTANQSDGAGFIAVDAAGDVFVGGGVTDLAPTGEDQSVRTVLRLGGSDGRPRWRQSVTELTLMQAMALDGAGGVIAAGSSFTATGQHFTVVKLDGASGAVAWTATIQRPDTRFQTALGVVALPSGDVAAVGVAGGDGQRRQLTVAAFDGATGTERWRRFIEGSDGYGGEGASLGVTPSGGLVVGGQVRNTGTCYDILVAELSAATGATEVERNLDGTTRATKCDPPPCDPRGGECPFTREGIDQDTLNALTVDAQGRIVVSGRFSEGRRGRARAVVAQLALGG
jgi:outer membrane protein assembly factor BamB